MSVIEEGARIAGIGFGTVFLILVLLAGILWAIDLVVARMEKRD